MKFADIVLAALALATIAGFIHNQWTPGIFERTGLIRGWDFQQFYVAARMPIADLYDPAKFQAMQRSLLPMDEQNIPFLPLYPPMVSVAMTPLAMLSYPAALGVWSVVSLACYAIAGWLLIRRLDQEWRPTAALVAAGFLPLFVALRAGQLAPPLLLAVVAGLQCGNVIRSGLVLSLLAVKPQFAVGMFVYQLLRQQWGTCFGMVLGVLLQSLAVVALVGPDVLFDYLSFAAIYLIHSEIYGFPPGWVHSLSGTCGKGIHLGVLAIVAVVAAFLPLRNHKAEGVLSVAFMLLLTPHLLLYDLLFLIVPIAYLLPQWKMSTALLLASSAIALPLCAATGLSAVPFLLIALFGIQFYDQLKCRLVDPLCRLYVSRRDFGLEARSL